MNISEAAQKNGAGHPFVNPDYMTLYKWEGEQFDYSGWHAWMRSSKPVSFSLVASYLFLIAVGRQWMKNREPFRFKGPLVLWNVCLAVFSIIAFVRTVPELVYLMRKTEGFHESVCIRDEMNIATVHWALVPFYEVH